MPLITPDIPYAVVRPSGEIDVSTRDRLRDELLELIATGHHHLAVDLSDVTFIDSSGMGALVAATRALPDPSCLVLAAPIPRVARVLELTGLTALFQVWDTMDVARFRALSEQVA